MCNQLYKSSIRRAVLRLLLLVYVCVHVYIVLQQPVIGTKVCNQDFAPRVKTQGIPKHIEAATHEIPWYICIYAAPCLSMFCIIVYRQVSHATQTQKLPCRYSDTHFMPTRQNINSSTTNVGRLVKAFGFRYFLYKVLRLRGYMQCYQECACMRIFTSEHRVSIGLCKWRHCMTQNT